MFNINSTNIITTLSKIFFFLTTCLVNVKGNIFYEKSVNYNEISIKVCHFIDSRMTAVDKKKVDAKKLPAVPESKVKVAKKLLTARAIATKRKIVKTKTIKLRIRENFLRAEKYAKEYARTERREILKRRVAKKEGNYYIPGEARLAFVLRIRG